MIKIAWKKCITISLITAFIAAFLSITIVIPVDGNEEVLDLNAIDFLKFETMNDKQIEKYISSVPTIKLTGIERFTYQFSHPQVWWFYFKSVITWFIGLFTATSIISYLHFREERA